MDPRRCPFLLGVLAVAALVVLWLAALLVWLDDTSGRRGADAARRATNAARFRGGTGSHRRAGTFSGRPTARSTTACNTMAVAITDSAGRVVHRPEYVYSLRFGVCMTWSPRRDQAWLASRDVGIRVVEPDAATGTWTELALDLVDRADVPPVVLSNQPRYFDR